MSSSSQSGSERRDGTGRSLFEDLAGRYYLDVYRICRSRLGSREDAEDAAQEVFCRALGSFHTYDPARSPWNWLYTITLNHLRSRHERARRRKANDLLCAPVLEQRATIPETDSERRDRIRHVREAVAGLPDRLKLVVMLFYGEGLSVSGTAECLGISRENVKVRLYRARARLRSVMEARDGVQGLSA